MSTVAAGIAALLASGEKAAHVTQKGLSLFKAAESNPSAVARFEETSAAATREMLKDCYAAVKALVAVAILGDHPKPAMKDHLKPGHQM